MSSASKALKSGFVFIGALTAAGSAHGMVPDISNLAARTAEAAGCLVATIEEDGNRDGYLMFTVTCKSGSSSPAGDVACKGGACTFRPSAASAASD